MINSVNSSMGNLVNSSALSAGSLAPAELRQYIAQYFGPSGNQAALMPQTAEASLANTLSQLVDLVSNLAQMVQSLVSGALGQSAQTSLEQPLALENYAQPMSAQFATTQTAAAPEAEEKGGFLSTALKWLGKGAEYLFGGESEKSEAKSGFSLGSLFDSATSWLSKSDIGSSIMNFFK